MTALEEPTPFDHTSDPNFLAYYALQSASEATLGRFSRVKDRALWLLAERGQRTEGLMMLDIGCGAGTQACLWAQAGHQAHGIDVNAQLIEVGQARARAEGLSLSLEVGSATQLPIADSCMDICLMPELLEHVQDWQSCLREAVRVLKPGGLLYVSTSNVMCPLQNEFNLPLYSWYPGFAKRHFEKLAVTSRPDLANYARYPAVHWFSFGGLRRFLRPLGMDCHDRFDVIDARHRPAPMRWALTIVKNTPALHWVGQMLTQGTTVWAFKQG